MSGKESVAIFHLPQSDPAFSFGCKWDQLGAELQRNEEW